MTRVRQWRLLLVVAVVAGLTAWQLIGPTGPLGHVLRLILGEETEYAPGYSAIAFLRVRAGDSPEEVRNLLGEPLVDGRDGVGNRVWHYSRPRSETANYLVRGVRFRPDGVVRDKLDWFEVD